MIDDHNSTQALASRSSIAEKTQAQSDMTSKLGINTMLLNDGVSPTEENSNNHQSNQQESPSGSNASFLTKIGQQIKDEEELEAATKRRKLYHQTGSHSLDALDITVVPNDFEVSSWTVRNSDGFQEELMKSNFESCDAIDTELELSTTEETLQAGLQQSLESNDDTVLVHLLLSFPEPLDDEIWNTVQASLKISQSVTEQELVLPISQTSFFCCQRAEDIPTPDAKLSREISACVTVKQYLHNTSTRYLLQLFLVIEGKQAGTSVTPWYWNKMNVIAFVQFPLTGQLLYPIEREISRAEALQSSDGVFLGSLIMCDRKMYHHVPNESSLRRNGTIDGCYSAVNQIDSDREEVALVDRQDIVLEPNGARAGRPSHRETGQLLMTASQVEKVLEIRRRWEGLSPRQRRDNVTEADFYTFLTLNRDETAECLGVCATWLKDAIRSQGVHVWPGRPLRRTGAMLQTLKESLESTRAALRFSDPAIGETKRYEADIERFESEIRDLLVMRVEIVKANVSAPYFDRFVQENGKQYLDPDWNALPPHAAHRGGICSVPRI